MKLAFKILIVVVIGIIVCATALIYSFTSLSSAEGETKKIWIFSFNITENVTRKAGETKPKVGFCVERGERCVTDFDCCANLVCRRESPVSFKICLPCAEVGDFCEENSDCCSNNCITVNSDHECG